MNSIPSAVRSLRSRDLLLLGVLAAASACAGAPATGTTTPATAARVPSAADMQWEFYLADTDEGPFSVMFVLDYADVAPLADAPMRLDVGIPMRSPGPNGLGDASEAEEMNRLDLALHRELETRLAARAVGRIRGGGMWIFVYYAPSDEGLEDAVRAALAGSPGREFDVGSERDPSWSAYRESLLPDRERWQWIQDRRVVDALESQGDPLTTPRSVEHFLYFEQEDARARFAEAARERGFTVVGESAGEGDARFGIRVSRVHAVDLDAVHAVVMELVELASASDGEYDGWETEVLGPGSPAP